MSGFDPKALLGELDAGALEALVQTMVLAARADDDFSDDERTELADSIKALAEGTEHAEALQGEPLEALLSRAEKELDAEGRSARIAAVKERLASDDARKAALGLAISVTAADGIVRTSEREVIMDLAEGLGVDRDVAAALVAAITKK